MFSQLNVPYPMYLCKDSYLVVSKLFPLVGDHCVYIYLHVMSCALYDTS